MTDAKLLQNKTISKLRHTYSSSVNFAENCPVDTFDNFQLKKTLNNAVAELGFEKPTPIQSAAFSVILSGKDILGVAQTGTGKTLAYLLPTLDEMTFSKQLTPRVLIMVPTRELVLQVVEEIERLTAYISVKRTENPSKFTPQTCVISHSTYISSIISTSGNTRTSLMNF